MVVSDWVAVAAMLKHNQPQFKRRVAAPPNFGFEFAAEFATLAP
jgi:uncharacterized protein YcbX